MHEMSIVEGLIEAVQAEMRRHPDLRLRSVCLRVGSLRQVVPDLLQFCYEAATRDSPLAGSTLRVETIPALARCRACQLDFAVEDNWFECPRCRSVDVHLLKGRELDLVELELEEPIVAPAA